MRWRSIRRRLGIACLLLALIVVYWPHVLQHADAGPNDFTINPPSGPPGTTITITPNPPSFNSMKFSAGGQIDLFYYDLCDAPFDVTNYKVNPDGTLPTMQLQVPTTTTCTSAVIEAVVDQIGLGPTNFQITGTNGGTPLPTATGTLATSTPTVPGTPATPVTTSQFTVNPTTAALGQTVSYSAGGFRPGESVTLSAQINGAVVALTPTGGVPVADANGFVVGTFTLPVTNQTIVGNGGNGNSGYTATLHVLGVSSAYQQAAILTVPPTTISGGTSNITPGGTFSITGGGFQANETIALSLVAPNNGTVTSLGTTLTHGDGTISANVTAPNVNGNYTLKAQGQSSNLNASQVLVIGAGLGLTVTPLITAPNTSVLVHGFGFTPNAPITLNGLGNAPVSVTSDAQGAFSITLPVPTSLTGNVITVHANDNNALSASTYLTIDTGQPATVAVSSTSASPGTALSVTGANFAAGEKVNLSLSPNVSPPAPIANTSEVATVDATRAFSVTYVLPTLANGNYLLLATGQGSNRTAVTSVTVINGLPGPTDTPTTSTGYVPFPTATNTQIGVPTNTPTAVAGGPTETTYFAEGYTGLAGTNGRATFAEHLNLFNTTTGTTGVTVTYYVQSGSTGATTKIVKSLSLGALGAATLSVNTDAGNDKLVSIAVGHVPGVAAQMAITRTDPKGGVLDAAASTGSAQAATTWQFAEGYTGGAFQEYLSFFNPSAAPANVHVRFLPTSGVPPQPLTYTVPAGGRQSINVRAVYLGLVGVHAPKSIAISVTSDQQIVTDRVLYWGDGGGSGKFGYEIAPGIPSGSTTLAFPALVLTGSDEPYITVLNPGSTPASAQIVFRDSAGHTLATYTNSLAPLARLTVPVRAILRTASGVVSATLSATAPVVAEAPVYFGGSPNKGTHPGVAELGFAGALSTAAGGLDPSSATLYVFNPGSVPVQVTRTLGTPAGSGGAVTFTVQPLGLYLSALPAGGGGPRGLLLTGQAPFVAAVINGGDSARAAWGGTLLPAR